MNTFHPSAVIIGDVSWGENNYLGPNAIVYGPAVVGSDNWIGANSVIGAPPEIRKFRINQPNNFGVRIGSRNIIREAVQIHQGSHITTSIGDDNYIMNQSYIAHDCKIEDFVNISSSCLLAGGVKIGYGANLGLGVVVHQGVVIGGHSMIGMGSVVTRNILPFSKSFGVPCRLISTNSIGMERSGFSNTDIEIVDKLLSSELTSSEHFVFDGNQIHSAKVNDVFLEFISNTS